MVHITHIKHVHCCDWFLWNLTCAFFNSSVKTENQSGVSVSSSKVMMAKANVEPLNCHSWWHAMQCCTCLVHSATWRQGLF